MTLHLLPASYAVCRLEAGADVPAWAAGDFVSITRTPDELSVVCPDDRVPPEVTAQRGWRLMQVQGPLSFDLVGILAALTKALADAEVPVFVISTYETDMLLIRSPDLPKAQQVLRRGGHEVS